MRALLSRKQPSLSVCACMIQQSIPSRCVCREGAILPFGRRSPAEPKHMLEPYGWMVRKPYCKDGCTLSRACGLLANGSMTESMQVRVLVGDAIVGR